MHWSRQRRRLCPAGPHVTAADAVGRDDLHVIWTATKLASGGNARSAAPQRWVHWEQMLSHG